MNSDADISQDLIQAGIMVEPFFISTEERPFDLSKFYAVRNFDFLGYIEFGTKPHPQSVLAPTNIIHDEDTDVGVLPESVSITKVDDLLSQMRFHEVPKRSLFSIPFELAKDFIIGVKGSVSVSYDIVAPLTADELPDTALSQNRRGELTDILQIWAIEWLQ